MSIPTGTVVEWNVAPDWTVEGVVQADPEPYRGRTLVKMWPGQYDVEGWRDGLRYIKTEYLRVVK